jgi:hypothetical protein
MTLNFGKHQPAGVAQVAHVHERETCSSCRKKNPVTLDEFGSQRRHEVLHEAGGPEQRPSDAARFEGLLLPMRRSEGIMLIALDRQERDVPNPRLFRTRDQSFEGIVQLRQAH